MSLTADPRWIEHRDAYQAVSRGLSAPEGARERYLQSLGPYLDLLADITPEHMRSHMMEALFDGEEHITLGLLAVAFRATNEELEPIRDRPPIQPEPVDEIDRLQCLPYGAYLKTQHWQQVRKAALERAEGRCSLCNNATRRLEVHHRFYGRKGAERPADVIALCDQCHGRHHETKVA